MARLLIILGSYLKSLYPLYKCLYKEEILDIGF